MVEVVGADLEQLLVRALPQPLGEPRVVLGPARLRETAVRNLLDQHVLEAIRRLAGDRRARLPRDEVAKQEIVEHVFELVCVVLRREVIDGSRPEDAADHRAALQDDLLAGRQPVDARTDQRLQ